MGNSNPKRVEKYGGFHQTEEPCQCPNHKKEITHIEYVSCPLSNPFVHVTMNIVSKVVLKNYVHSAIEFIYKCKVCKKLGYIVIGFTDSGVYKKSGYFTKCSVLVIGGEKTPEKMDLFDVMGVTLRLENSKYTKQDYNLLSRNSQHFANDLWDEV